MDKIKAFFANTITKVIAWVVLALSAVILIVGGTSAASLSTGVELVGAIVAAVAALVAFIAERVKKSE